MLLMKKCTVCSEVKSLNLYHKNKLVKTGVHSACAACRNKARKNSIAAKSYVKKYKNTQKNNDLIRKYGITIELYNKILESQNFSCYICKKYKSSQNRSLSVDHCHKTGKIRGILCDKCNRGLGFFNDNPELLINASNYLKKIIE